MRCVSQGDLERAIYNLMNELGLYFDGITNRECIEILRENCPQLHSDEELKEFSDNLLTAIFDKFGFEGLRVWYCVRMKSQFGHDMLQMKYDNLLKEITGFVNNYREEEGIVLTLDVYRACIFLKESFKSRFGVLDEDELNDLYSLLHTLDLTQYQDDMIDSLKELIHMQLVFCGDNYYCHKDLGDKEVLRDCHLYVSEVLGKGDVYRGHDFFYGYDGYGGYMTLI